MDEREAFFQVVKNAKPAKSSYVSLYATVPFYGGPEEGGWWSSDTELVAYAECSNDHEAEAIWGEVEALAKQLSADAKQGFNRYCRDSLDDAEAKGIDADELPEVDGAESYWVTTEDAPGSLTSQGSRHYE